jgi:hypothetical protein
MLRNRGAISRFATKLLHQKQLKQQSNMPSSNLAAFREKFQNAKHGKLLIFAQ